MSESDETLSQIKKSVLLEVFPIDCRLVGNENLDDLCMGRLALDEDDYAFRMSAGESLAILANAVTIVAFLWQVFHDRRAARSKAAAAPPTPEEIDSRLIRELRLSAELPKEKRLALIAAVFVVPNPRR